MEELTFIALREKPKLKDTAAEWFHSKWGVPKEAYLECMESYLNNETEYGWAGLRVCPSTRAGSDHQS